MDPGFSMSQTGRPFLLAAAGFVASVAASPNFNAPLTRPYTLRMAEANPLERQYHELIAENGRRTFIHPRPCMGIPGRPESCRGGRGLLHYADSAQKALLDLHPIIGLEFRYFEENAAAVDWGLETMGRKGRLSYYLDARMFIEGHEDFNHFPYDREFVERQDEEASGSVDYSSYSRYRGNLAYDTDFGRFWGGRDAAHWGPGQFTNLVFHQNAIPFDQVVFSTWLGPLNITSLYGQLAIDADSNFRKDEASRSVYAHRYEWNATNWLMFGISEQLVLYQHELPFAFLPVVPLYIAKGNSSERENNGNIAGDFSWKIGNVAQLYSEFLIDDLQSPTSILDDYWGNKWGWMVGGHYLWEPFWGSGGVVVEWARIEPWVYTHYQNHTAQAANLNRPLGNQTGPNSQAIVLKVYSGGGESSGGIWGAAASSRAKAPEPVQSAGDAGAIRLGRGRESGISWYVSGQLELVWKGSDRGSSITDTLTSRDRSEPKVFINGVESPKIIASPEMSLSWRNLTVAGRMRTGTSTEAFIRLHYRY